KLHVVRPPAEGGYGTTLHRDYAGEFDYDLRWKPIGGFPITAGWLYAVRRGHARLHRGLDVGVPNLILRSDHSVPEDAEPDRLQRGDAVLDVTQIARWAGCIGNRTTVIPIVDAKHDVFLSLPEPRRTAYRELDCWLDWYASQPVPGTLRSEPEAVVRPERSESAGEFSTSPSAAPGRATACWTSATLTSRWRSARRRCSAAPVSTWDAFRARCSATPPMWPRP